VAKGRVHTDMSKITSHTVLLVDQSGSMKKGDVSGHRSRSRAAYYAIANELVASQIIH
jgi:hypothetical protein